MSELKPCPFCNGAPKMLDFAGGFHQVSCGCVSSVGHYGTEAAIKAWNTMVIEEWTEDDEPLPEDGAIKAAHPRNTDKFDTYDEALRMVSAKRSKYALVDLVNWLLVKGESKEKD